MAEGDGAVFNYAKYQMLTGGVDMGVDTLKIALLGASYAPSVDNDEVWADISAHEVSGTGYTAGGLTLAGATVSQDNANDRAVLDASDPSWAALDIGTPAWAVIYKWTGSAATSPVIARWQLGTTPTTGGAYTLRFNTAGVILLG